MTFLKIYLKLMRPHQWIKNAFVFIGLIFGHAWHNTELVYQVSLAAIAFCFMSSAVYIYNDIIDKPHDCLHPQKKERPLASGKVSVKECSIFLIALFFLALCLGWFASTKVTLILLGYALLNVLYTHWLKHIVIIDVFAISAGFMLRILAGTIGVSIIPSQWLMFCGLMLTLFLGFAKRRAENLMIDHQKDFPRKVLKEYNHVILDKMIGITASCSIIGYGLYTMNEQTILTHKTNNLIYTIPFVIYGIFRYLYLLHKSTVHAGQDISKEIWEDKHLLITILLWFIVTLLMIS